MSMCLQNIGSCSSDGQSANAKATLFLAEAGHKHHHDSNSYGAQSNKSLDVGSPKANFLASVCQSCQGCPLTCILPNQHDSGSDEKCLSPLAVEGCCRSLTSHVTRCAAQCSAAPVCVAQNEPRGPGHWTQSQRETFQNNSCLISCANPLAATNKFFNYP